MALFLCLAERRVYFISYQRAADRALKGQAVGREHETSAVLIALAITRIAHYWVANVIKVAANLVLAAGL